MLDQTQCGSVSSTISRAGRMIAGAALILAIAGCAGNESDDELVLPTTSAEPGLAAQPGGTGPSAPGELAEALVKLATEGAKETTYQPAGGGDSLPAGTKLVVKRSKPPSERGTPWLVPREVVCNGVSDNSQRSDLTFVIDKADGSLRLVSTIEAADEVFTEFRPPLLVVPSQMTVGKGASITEPVELIVHPRGQPNKIKSQGKGTNTLTLIGRDAVAVKGVNVESLKLIARLQVDMSPAKVLTVTESWYAVDGSGLIAERRTERVTLAGLLIRNKKQHWVIDR